MSDEVIIGYDGKPRCAWAGVGDIPAVRYHDEVWGTRTDDESALFEALTLGVFEAGLSWSIVFGKRDAFRAAFHDFDVARFYATDRKRAPRSLADLPSSTPQADAFAKQLKAQGYRFVGPTSVYAFMQNIGVVNDHLDGCFRATDHTNAGAAARR